MISRHLYNNREEWRHLEKLHRNDGPAVIYNNGTEEWWINGLLHRVNGPAIKSFHCVSWYQHGKLHREDGPASIYFCGLRQWYQFGLLHRKDGPAVLHSCGNWEWYQCGKLHRLDGPAEGSGEWFLDGQHISDLALKIYQQSRICSLVIALSPLELPPYVVFWILEWSECNYISELPQYAVIKVLEGVRNSRKRIKIDSIFTLNQT